MFGSAGITAITLWSNHPLWSLRLMADDRNGRPSLHPLQHPDLWGDLRLLPHYVGHDPWGQCQSHTLLHWPKPQREQGPQPLQTQGLTSCTFLYPSPGHTYPLYSCSYCILDSHLSIFTIAVMKKSSFCTPYSLNDTGKQAFYWGLVGLTDGSNCLILH